MSECARTRTQIYSYANKVDSSFRFVSSFFLFFSVYLSLSLISFNKFIDRELAAQNEIYEMCVRVCDGVAGVDWLERDLKYGNEQWSWFFFFLLLTVKYSMNIVSYIEVSIGTGMHTVAKQPKFILNEQTIGTIVDGWQFYISLA